MTSNTTSSSLLRGSAILIIWGSQSNLSIPDERALNDWWTNEHLPERLAIPGFHRTRRYYYSSSDPESDDANKGSVQFGTSRRSHYLVVYEVSSLSTLTSEPYMQALNTPTPGTKKYLPFVAGLNRSACNVLTSVSRNEFAQCKVGGVGGTIAHVVFEPPSSPSARDELVKWLGNGGWKIIADFFPSVLALHVLEHDDEASRSGSSTKSYEDVKFQQVTSSAGEAGMKWMLLVEFSDAFDAPFASYKEKCKALAEGLMEHGIDLSKLKEEIYGLSVVMEE